MQNAVAFANNDITTIAWSYGRRPDGCMGFAIYRIDRKGTETPLPSHAVFPGHTIKPGQTTAQFPIQKFYWKDPYARLVAERTGNRFFRYKIVPLEGAPDSLTPMAGLPLVITNEVELTSEVAHGVHAVFNRGLISTQRVSRAFGGKPAKGPLLDQIADPASALRASLSGDMVETLIGFVDRAGSTGRIYAALYELHDAQLLARLEALGTRLHIVLSNADPIDPNTPDSNQPAADRLSASAGTFVYRALAHNHIGHNKFLVHTSRDGTPRDVLLGSTNWTPTGLCAQTNNTMVVRDKALATRYRAYWARLVTDTAAAAGDPNALQGADLRGSNATGQGFPVAGGKDLQSWFSPNTPHARGKVTGELRPPDMNDVVARIDAATQAVLFLAFYPGSPSVANWAAQALRKDKELFVRGCVTNRNTAAGFYYELRGMTPPQPGPGQPPPPLREDYRVLGAEAFDGKVIPEGWTQEILNAGFAIIHDKVVVIDPFSPDCVVVTGSHNLGHKASYDNDENLVIVEGNRKLAVAYATHVLDVYDHFAFRYLVKRLGPQGADQYLKEKPEEWLSRYFDAAGAITSAQLRFWMQATL